MRTYTLSMSLALVLAAGCQTDSDSEHILSRSQHLVTAVDEGLRQASHEEGHEAAEIPFGQIVSGLDSESASLLPPGSPEIASGGTGGPEIGSGGVGSPEITSGGTGTPDIPPGGLGTPGGSLSFAGAVCDFLDAICERLVVCLAAEFEAEAASCAEVRAVCLPAVQQSLYESGVTQVPPAAITYLNCVTDAVRSSTCSIFEEEGFIEPIEACLPAGISFDGGGQDEVPIDQTN